MKTGKANFEFLQNSASFAGKPMTRRRALLRSNLAR